MSNAHITETHQFLALLREQLQKTITEAAEPVIQAAIKDAEVQIRAAIGRHVLGILETSYRMETRGNTLSIEVLLPSNKGPQSR